MSKTTQDEDNGRYVRPMTVAHIREREDADTIEVVFLESARFFKLFKKGPAFDEALKLLEDALVSHRVLEIGTTSIDSDVIEEVRERRPGAPE